MQVQGVLLGVGARPFFRKQRAITVSPDLAPTLNVQLSVFVCMHIKATHKSCLELDNILLSYRIEEDKRMLIGMSDKTCTKDPKFIHYNS